MQARCRLWAAAIKKHRSVLRENQEHTECAETNNIQAALREKTEALYQGSLPRRLFDHAVSAGGIGMRWRGRTAVIPLARLPPDQWPTRGGRECSSREWQQTSAGRKPPRT